jgi:vancomycin resistance protein YoaR
LLPLVLLFLLAAAAGVYSWRYSGRVYPGVQALGVDLRGLTLDEATALIERKARPQLERPVELRYQDKSLSVTGAELGVAFDSRATAEQALAFGRQGGMAGQWQDRLSSWSRRPQVAPVVSLDERQAEETLRRLEAQIDRPVVDAGLSLGAGGPEWRASQVGLDMDVPSSLKALSAAVATPQGLKGVVAPVVHATQPQVSDAQLAAAHERLRAAWSRPLKLAFAGRDWTMPTAKVRELIRLQGQGAQTAPAIQEAPLRRWVESVAQSVDRTSRDATYRVSTGKVELVPGRDAYAVDVPETVRRAREAVFAPEGRAELAVRVTPPAVTDAELLPAVREADVTIRRPLTVQADGRSWSLDQETLTKLLKWRGEGERQEAYLRPAGLGALVRKAAGELDRPVRDARLNRTETETRVVPEQSGIKTDIVASVRALQAAAAEDSGVAQLVTSVTPPRVYGSQLQPAADRANTLVSEPVRLVHEDESWTADPEDLREWLRWKGEGVAAQPYLDGAEISEFVEDVADDANQEVENATLSAEGKLPEIVPGENGVVVDERATAAVFSRLAASPSEREGRVVARVTQPTVKAADLQPALKEALRLVGERLYLTYNGKRWWLDPADLTDTLRFEGEGAKVRPVISKTLMREELRQWVDPRGYVVVSFRPTTTKVLAALKSGNRTVPLVARNVATGAVTQHAGNVEYWGDDPPDRWLDLNLTTQSIAAYEGSTQVRRSLITSGRPELRTPTGLYHIKLKRRNMIFKSPWPKTSQWWYPDSPTHYAILFKHNGFFIHDAPWRKRYGPGTNGGGENGSYTGSHGCVNVPLSTMRFIYRWVDIGTPVLIHY